MAYLLDRLRLHCFCPLHLFLLLLALLRNGLLLGASLLLSLVVGLDCGGLLRSCFRQALLVNVLGLERWNQSEGLLEDCLRDFRLNCAFDTISPVTFRPARHVYLQLIVLLIELVDLDLALARAVRVISLGALGFPIEFALELKHRRLLLLPNRD